MSEACEEEEQCEKKNKDLRRLLHHHLRLHCSTQEDICVKWQRMGDLKEEEGYNKKCKGENVFPLCEEVMCEEGIIL